jgi:hypothetical protein
LRLKLTGLTVSKVELEPSAIKLIKRIDGIGTD